MRACVCVCARACACELTFISDWMGSYCGGNEDSSYLRYNAADYISKLFKGTSFTLKNPVVIVQVLEIKDTV